MEVTNRAEADIVIGQIAAWQKEIKGYEKDRDEMIARYNEWHDEHVGQLKNNIAYAESLLRAWAQKSLEGRKERSIDLPHGRVYFRKAQDKWTAGGEKAGSGNKALIDWAKKNCPYLCATRSEDVLLWGTMKDRITEAHGKFFLNGLALPDGLLTREEGEDTFYVKGDL